MKSLLKLLLFIIIIALKIHAQTSVEKYGDLQVVGINLSDSAGNPIQLRGMSSHGLQYFSEFYNENIFASLSQSWNADVIRLANYVNEGWGDYGNYLQEPNYWRMKIDTLIGYAEQYGLYVIIDWHTLMPGDPNAYLTEAKEFWTYMSTTHGNKDNVLFEICNEPNNDSTYDSNWNSISYVNGVTWKDNIKKYAEEILPIIRANSDNVVLVGTERWASRPDLVIGEELAFDNVMYSTHFYAGEHKENYRNYLRTALSEGIPLFVTEFGTQMADGNQNNDFESSDTWLDFLDSNKISWVNWNLSNDHRSGAVYKNDISFNSIESYSDTGNLKEAGLWIFNRLKNGDVAITKNNILKTGSSISYKLINNKVLFSKSFNKGTRFKIYDMRGKEILRKEFVGNSVNIGSFSHGVYMIEVVDEGFRMKNLITVY